MDFSEQDLDLFREDSDNDNNNGPRRSGSSSPSSSSGSSSSSSSAAAAACSSDGAGGGQSGSGASSGEEEEDGVEVAEGRFYSENNDKGFDGTWENTWESHWCKTGVVQDSSRILFDKFRLNLVAGKQSLRPLQGGAANGSAVRPTILKGHELLQRSLCWNVGDSKSIKFWSDFMADGCAIN